MTESVGTHAYLIKALKEYAKTTSKALQPIFDNATVRMKDLSPYASKINWLARIVYLEKNVFN